MIYRLLDRWRWRRVRCAVCGRRLRSGEEIIQRAVWSNHPPDGYYRAEDADIVQAWCAPHGVDPVEIRPFR